MLVRRSSGKGFSFKTYLFAIAICQFISFMFGAACRPFFRIGRFGARVASDSADIIFLSQRSKILLVSFIAASSSASAAVNGLLESPSSRLANAPD